ncbi:MAG TPA: DUF1648 domain-containing protein [Verrucomicrobiae bacterium]|jgi:uncharacterized membrane protein|nr:DUF1648 domain-containing protein [Verrucomicrobiae bacterium]
MSGTTVPRGLFFAIVFAAIVQGVYGFPLLPDRMASHFAASGMPNGWMTKPQFFAVYAATLLPALVVEFWVGRSVAKTPDARINLPNKEHWLAPERRATTFAYFENFFAWYGCALLLLVVFIMGLAMRANLTPPPRLPTGPTITALVVFVSYNIAAVVMVLRRFSAAR